MQEILKKFLAEQSIIKNGAKFSVEGVLKTPKQAAAHLETLRPKFPDELLRKTVFELQSALEGISKEIEPRIDLSKFDDRLGKLMSGDPTKYILGIDLGKNEKILLNSKLMPIDGVDPDQFMKSMTRKGKEEFHSSCAFCHLYYNPYELNPKGVVKERDGIPLLHVNSFIQPKYKNKLKGDASKIFKFVEHLFPSKESREFFYSWLHHATTSKALTYLYITGGQGIGKEALHRLLESFFGWDNSVRLKHNFLKSNFNSEIKNKQYANFDEFYCRTYHEREYLKTLLNPRIGIEGKGRKVEQVNLYLNILMTNNSYKNVVVNFEDRRFSMPEVTSVKLANFVGKEDLEYYFNLDEDPGALSAFHEFVENYSPKYGPHDQCRTKTFEKTCIESQPFIREVAVKKILSEVVNGITFFEYNKCKMQAEKAAKTRGTFSGNQYAAGFFSTDDFRNYFEEFTWNGVKLCHSVTENALREPELNINQDIIKELASDDEMMTNLDIEAALKRE